MNISAIVMASGMSKRMNKDKLRMIINNIQIYGFVLELISKCSFYETVVVSKDDEILDTAVKYGFKGIKNTEYFLGQSRSIVKGIESLKDTDGYMFFVADQPFLSIDTVKLLCSVFEENPEKIIVPYCNEKRGNPVIFPTSLKEKLLVLEGDSGGKSVINNNEDKVIRVNINKKEEFMDIDTIEDYENVKNKKVKQ